MKNLKFCSIDAVKVWKRPLDFFIKQNVSDNAYFDFCVVVVELLVEVI